jgi:hypothetical protein
MMSGQRSAVSNQLSTVGSARAGTDVNVDPSFFAANLLTAES